MDYLNYVCEIAQDIYDDLYFRYIDFTYNIKYEGEPIKICYDDEINKLIEDTKKEIQIDKEIKDLEKRYEVLCKDVNKIYEQDNDNDNHNHNDNNNDNEGAIKIKNKKIGILL